jgi:hypothetical protein
VFGEMFQAHPRAGGLSIGRGGIGFWTGHSGFGLVVSHKGPSEDKAQNPQVRSAPGRDPYFACVSY